MTAQDLCGLRWNQREGDTWHSPDGTTSLWRAYDSAWKIQTTNPIVAQRLNGLSKIDSMQFCPRGLYATVFDVPWMKFSTKSLANALAPACGAKLESEEGFVAPTVPRGAG